MPPNQSHQVQRRLAVMGCRGVGKTSLIKCFVGDDPDENYFPTVEGTHSKMVSIDNKRFECDILDTAGQDEYSTPVYRHFSAIDGYIVVLSLISSETLEGARAFLDRILDLDRGNQMFYLVANKLDVASKATRQVETKALQTLAEKYKCRWFESSARDGTNVNMIFESLLRDIEKKSNPPDESKGRLCPIM